MKLKIVICWLMIVSSMMQAGDGPRHRTSCRRRLAIIFTAVGMAIGISLGLVKVAQYGFCQSGLYSEVQGCVSPGTNMTNECFAVTAFRCHDHRQDSYTSGLKCPLKGVVTDHDIFQVPQVTDLQTNYEDVCVHKLSCTNSRNITCTSWPAPKNSTNLESPEPKPAKKELTPTERKAQFMQKKLRGNG